VSESRYSTNQKAAIITLVVTALSGLALLYVNMTIPGGASVDEIIFLGTATMILAALVPLYLAKVSWSWATGMVAFLGLYLGPAIQALEGAYIFSLTIYNATVVAFYAIATAGLFFSFMSLREQPRRKLKKTALAVTGTVLAIAAMFCVVLPSYSSRISWYMGESSIGNIRESIEQLNGYEEKIDYLVNSERMPSFAAGIVANGELIWNRGWGASSEETIYAINSMTKTFTATSVLQLYERNLIGLDDDVNEYLPFTLRHPDYPDTPITIRMLLTHQSGLNHKTDNFDDYTMGEEFLDLMIKFGIRPVNKAVQDVPSEEFFGKLVDPDGEFFTPDVWTSNKPGTKYSYSNIGFDILTLIVEAVTGRGYPDYLRENVLDPLGMTSTVFSIHEFPERQAVPHERLYGALLKTMMQLPLYGRTMFGAGGLRSTVKDISRFMIALMNDGAYGDYQMLQPETVALMKSVQARVPLGHGDALQVENGLGLSLLDDEACRYWNHEYNMHGAMGHGGSNPGWTSGMWFAENVKGSYGIITMTNHKQTYKPDNGLYTISVIYTIQELLIDEAYERHLEPEFELDLDLPF
jgi:CubicO group peptidase (beta-lactamase class C family)